MKAKNKKRPEAAQQLIDSLLEEEVDPKAGVVKSVIDTDLRDHDEAFELNAADVAVEELVLPTPPMLDADELTKSDVTIETPLAVPVPRSTTPTMSPIMSDDPDRTEQVALRITKSIAPPFDGGSPLVTQLAEVSPKAAANSPRPLSIPQPPAEISAEKNFSVGAAAMGAAEAQLKQSENLRIAQSRLSELDREIERLRRENEALASAGETLRRRCDELLSKSEYLEIQNREVQKISEEEKKVLRGQMQAKERENHELRGQVEEMENRLESNFKKIRVRERELEHRLEIVKMEGATLVSSKDKMILELKRQIDQISHEAEYGKQRTQELFNQFKEKQDTIRRVVRALRIALTILEGDEDSATPMKKVD